MINYLLQKRISRHRHRNREIAPAELEHARTLLFTVFSRYGDGIIAFKVIREFIACHPDKTYYLLTSHQLRPYAEALVDRRVKVLSVRKRSPRQMLDTLWRLHRAKIDIGFNPWGSPGESEFFLTLAERFYTFASLKFPVTENLYARVRQYLSLPAPERQENPPPVPQPVKRLLLAPFSTDVRKGLAVADVASLLAWLGRQFPGARVTVALAEEEQKRVRGLPVTEVFIFGKSEEKSRQFLRLVQESDLFAGVDAGPLHLADALGKPAIGLFGPTAPEAILDVDSRVLPLRAPELRGTFCAVHSCRDPRCLHALFRDDPEKVRWAASPCLKEERRVCRFLHPNGDSFTPA
ncbi:MAG: hypothetical protein JRI59_09945 [Deltaproteobacteria bacterium]|nr:hypothetical protein [Deltaproteobacteria bacterium]